MRRLCDSERCVPGVSKHSKPLGALTHRRLRSVARTVHVGRHHGAMVFGKVRRMNAFVSSRRAVAAAEGEGDKMAATGAAR